jgi:hypothetical protein
MVIGCSANGLPRSIYEAGATFKVGLTQTNPFVLTAASRRRSTKLKSTVRHRVNPKIVIRHVDRETGSRSIIYSGTEAHEDDFALFPARGRDRRAAQSEGSAIFWSASFPTGTPRGMFERI